MATRVCSENKSVSCLKSEVKCACSGERKLTDYTPVIQLPGSKSIAARAIVRAYVAGYDVTFDNLSECDDTKCLDNAVNQLRHIDNAQRDADGFVTFKLGLGGTSLRFFLALAASVPGVKARIICEKSLADRPIAPLVDTLVSMGAEILPIEKGDVCGWLVKGHRLVIDEDISFDSKESSQFLSALMLVGPLWDGDGSFSYSYNSVSVSYIEMTRRVIEKFLSPVSEFYIEGDWSAAAFFYEYVLLGGRSVKLRGLLPPEESMQGDSQIMYLMESLGVVTEWCDDGMALVHRCGDWREIVADTIFSANLRSTPDMVPALVFGLALAGVPFRMDGVAHLRHKESNRFTALKKELNKVGVNIKIGKDSLEWDGLRRSNRDGKMVVFDSHGDHRMAMAEAVTAVVLGDIEICGTDCISKSFPDFFNEIKKLYLVK